MKKRWNTSEKSVFSLVFYLLWCPKYRRKVLIGEVQDRLIDLLNQKAQELEIEIIKMEISPESIWMLVRSRPEYAPQFIMAQLKAFSSRILRKEFPELRKRLPTLWSRNYYIETVGAVSEEAIKQYIQDQKNN